MFKMRHFALPTPAITGSDGIARRLLARLMVGPGSDVVREAYDAVESLSRRTTIDGVIDAVAHAVARYGFRYFCFNALPDPQHGRTGATLANRLPTELRNVYVQERYAEVNPVIRFCRHTDRPFLWKDAPYDAEREPRAAAFVQCVTDFGLSGGLVFPITDARHPLGFVWMTGAPDNTVGPDLPLLHLMALCAFDRISRLQAPASNGYAPLTTRERDVLAWVAQGKSAWEIGMILGISKRTVDEHVRTACRKLNAGNRTQAVVAALRERLITP
jgi:LuxR family transcriptional regulator, quorum-sensing system regulator BjaR1